MNTIPQEKKPTAIGGIAVAATGALLILSVLSAPVANAQTKEDAQKLLKQADKDRDGNITWDEMLTMRKSIFVRLDRNQDGFVDKSDRPSFFGGQFDKAFERFIAFDTDGDERVSRQELLDGEAPVFETGDTNGDGVLSQSEIAALKGSQ